MPGQLLLLKFDSSGWDWDELTLAFRTHAQRTSLWENSLSGVGFAVCGFVL